MRQKNVMTEALPVNDGCRHYWVIETPEGLKSRGICRLCGKEHDFYNSWRYMEITGEPLGRR